MPPPAYRIATSRLVLRCWSPADAPLLKAAIDESLPHLQQWLDWAINEPSSLESIVERVRAFHEKFERNEDCTLGIFSANESRVLGGTGLHHLRSSREPYRMEIGYWLGKDHVGQGYATEAIAALTRVAFELHKVQRVEIHCDPANHRSAAVPARLGYRHEGTLRHHARTPDGRPRDTMIWGMTAEDYPSTPAAQCPIEAFDARGTRLL